MELVQRYAAASTLLVELSTSLSTASSVVRSLIKRSVHGVGPELLPKEILAKIFEETVDDENHPSRAFAMVCRRFREVALSTPNAWTSINTVYIDRTMGSYRELINPAEQLERQINLCGLLPLSFNFSNLDAYKPCACAALTILEKYKRRWREGRLAVKRNPLGNDGHSCLKQLGRVEFAILKSLDVGGGELHPEPIQDLYESVNNWLLPVLEDLVCATPGLLISPRFSHTLRLLDYRPGQNELGYERTLRSLGTQVLSSLTTLHLRLGQIGEFVPHGDDVELADRISLPNITDFSVDTTYGHNYNQLHCPTAFTMVERITLPNVVKITLSISAMHFLLHFLQDQMGFVRWLKQHIEMSSQLRDIWINTYTYAFPFLGREWKFQVREAFKSVLFRGYTLLCDPACDPDCNVTLSFHHRGAEPMQEDDFETPPNDVMVQNGIHTFLWHTEGKLSWCTRVDR